MTSVSSDPLTAADVVYVCSQEAVSDNPTHPLYRCVTTTAATADTTVGTTWSTGAPAGAAQSRHFFSIDASCEGKGTAERLLGHIAEARGGEMLR